MIICVAELLLCEPIQRKVSTLIIDKESWNIIQCGSNSRKKSRKIGSCVTFDQKSTDDMWQEIFLDHCLEEILLDEQTENQVRAQRLFHHVWRTHLAERLTLHTYIRGTHICIYQSKPFGWVGHICLHLTMEFFIAKLCPTRFPLHCLSANANSSALSNVRVNST